MSSPLQEGPVGGGILYLESYILSIYSVLRKLTTTSLNTLHHLLPAHNSLNDTLTQTPPPAMSRPQSLVTLLLVTVAGIASGIRPPTNHNPLILRFLPQAYTSLILRSRNWKRRSNWVGSKHSRSLDIYIYGRFAEFSVGRGLLSNIL